MSFRSLRRPASALLPALAALLASLPPATLVAQQGTRSPTARPAAASRSAARPAAKSAARPAVKTAAKPVAKSAARDSVDRLPGGRPRPKGWPVAGPAPLPGSILPGKRIIAYYGNPLSKRMGVLGEYEVDQMLAKLDREVARWNKADPSTPVQPALHLIAVVAQGDPGPSGKWRTRMRDSLIEKVYGWAQRKNALLFLDVQVGTGSLQEELPRLEQFLRRPDVHLGIDPEFSMKGGERPGSKIGHFTAADINYASRTLQDVVTRHKLPPKVLVVHRFTRSMVRGYRDIQLDPRVQVVMHMDGWGARWLKEDTYYDYVASEPVQFTGFKIFYHNDQKKAGSKVMTPDEVLTLYPKPVYIQYQ